MATKIQDNETMKTETIAPAQLPDALAHADRTAGWNFRDVPIRTATIASCIIYIVPAKVWAYRRQQQHAAAFWREQAG